MPNNIIRQDFGSLGNDVQTQMLIAPVLAEMIATQPFAIGDQFIVDNILYKATKAIAIGDAISVGTSITDNCVLSDSITQQTKIKFASGDEVTTTSTYIALPTDRRALGNIYVMYNGAAYIGMTAPAVSPRTGIIWALMKISDRTLSVPLANTTYTLYYDYLEV